MIRMVQFIQKTEDLNFLSLGGSGQIFGLIVRFYFNLKFLFLWSFKIWQIIIFSSKFLLNWAISSVFILYFILKLCLIYFLFSLYCRLKPREAALTMKINDYKFTPRTPGHRTTQAEYGSRKATYHR